MTIVAFEIMCICLPTLNTHIEPGTFKGYTGKFRLFNLSFVSALFMAKPLTDGSLKAALHSECCTIHLFLSAEDMAV